MIGKEEISGLVSIFAGVYLILLAKGVWQVNANDPDRSERIRCKFGRAMMVLAPLLILFGVIQAFGLLR